MDEKRLIETSFTSLSPDDSSISIPGLSLILIVGKSQTADEFSNKIRNIDKFESVYQVNDIKNAVGLMENVSFSIIVIDADDDFDPVGLSRLIHVHNSNSRIVLISQRIETKLVFDLKNRGIIHGFLLLPCNDILAHAVLAQQQALFHINHTLRKILPENSETINLTKLSINEEKQYELLKRVKFIGVAIQYATVSKFNLFFDTNLKIDPVLLTSYFSAISLFGEKILSEKDQFYSFEFHNLTIFLRNEGEIQFVYFLKYTGDQSFSQLNQKMNNLTNEIMKDFKHKFNSRHSITIEEEKRLTDLITNSLNVVEDKISAIDPDIKPIIFNYCPEGEALAELYQETSRVYQVENYDDQSTLLYDIETITPNLLIINNFEENFKQNKILINLVKDQSPSTTTLAVINELHAISIGNILNLNELDFIIHVDSLLEEYYSLIKKSIERSESIKLGSLSTDVSAVVISNYRSEIIKTMLRKNESQFDPITKPTFNGIFILKGNLKFYSNYLVEDKVNIKDKEYLFIGFIESLLTFSVEFSNSPLALSGIKYGNSSLIIQSFPPFTFIFFIGNLDSNNYNYINGILLEKGLEINKIIQDNDTHDFSIDNIAPLIESVFEEITERFSMINSD
ncbi:MAG: hypothetical protein OEY49_10990 [Candidatus Heimdallarchaeota archaeon]|nr:hypothetical protein [Candidatus Heimdallarchaeota archaeon]